MRQMMKQRDGHHRQLLALLDLTAPKVAAGKNDYTFLHALIDLRQNVAIRVGNSSPVNRRKTNWYFSPFQCQNSSSN